MALLLLANAVAFHETRRTNHAGDTGKDGRTDGRKEGRKEGRKDKDKDKEGQVHFRQRGPSSLILSLSHNSFRANRREPAMPCIAF